MINPERQMHRTLQVVMLSIALVARPGVAVAQAPIESEVRQIVTFSFTPGASSDAIAAFRVFAVPLYEDDDDMLSFRAFREIESPVSLDLMVVSSFRGMSGMDRSNSMLRGAGIGTFYGEIGEFIAGHTDQFVEMLPELGSGDPSMQSRTAFVWYEILPGRQRDFERALETVVVPWEEGSGISSATGRFLVSDGWHYLRTIGFESLGAYQNYWEELGRLPNYRNVQELTVTRREVIVALVNELSVR